LVGKSSKPRGTPYAIYRTFIDANVLIYAHDVDAEAKHEAAKSILRVL